MALASPDAPAADEFLYGPEDETGMGKKIDIAALKPVVGTLYPPPFDEPCPLRPASMAGPRPVGSASVWTPPDGLGADITSPLDVGWESSGAATITSGRWSVTVAIGGAGVARATPPNKAAIPSDARNPPVGPPDDPDETVLDALHLAGV